MDAEERMSLRLQAAMADVRGEVSGVRADLRTEIAEFRADLQSEIAGVRTEVASLRTELHDQLRAQTWRLAGLVVAMSAILFGIARVA